MGFRSGSHRNSTVVRWEARPRSFLIREGSKKSCQSQILTCLHHCDSLLLARPYWRMQSDRNNRPLLVLRTPATLLVERPPTFPATPLRVPQEGGRHDHKAKECRRNEEDKMPAPIACSRQGCGARFLQTMTPEHNVRIIKGNRQGYDQFRVSAFISHSSRRLTDQPAATEESTTSKRPTATPVHRMVQVSRLGRR